MVAIQPVTAEEFGQHDSSVPAAEVRRVAEACDAFDGVITLNEQACLQLKNRGLRDAQLWLARAGGEVVGFALLHSHILDLAVHPEHRAQGIGTELAQVATAAKERVEAWSHSAHPAAERIAERLGLPRERELRIMSRPTSVPVTAIEQPEGITIRPYQPRDEAPLLEVNAHAFRHHPEQGHMTAEDFEERMAEAWFDPAGLFVAVADDAEDGELLGFHWTKVHVDENPPYGEVYVVAVSPRAAGRGLGKVLTNTGLAHLATTGVDQVILYVDGNNEPAVAVYEGQGFEVVRTEVQYRGTPGRRV